MSDITITKTRFFEGVWEGEVTSSDELREPLLSVTHLETEVPGVQLKKLEGGSWALRIPIPPSLLADGVQVVLIQDTVTGETLENITIIADEAIASDIRAEVELLRAELDMLKRAFRRHCVETAE